MKPNLHTHRTASAGAIEDRDRGVEAAQHDRGSAEGGHAQASPVGVPDSSTAEHSGGLSAQSSKVWVGAPVEEIMGMVETTGARFHTGITHCLCVGCDTVLAGNPQTVGTPGASVLREGHCPVCEQAAFEGLEILFLTNGRQLTFEQLPPRTRAMALTKGWIRKENPNDVHFVPAGELAKSIC